MCTVPTANNDANDILFENRHPNTGPLPRKKIGKTEIEKKPDEFAFVPTTPSCFPSSAALKIFVYSVLLLAERNKQIDVYSPVTDPHRPDRCQHEAGKFCIRSAQNTAPRTPNYIIFYVRMRDFNLFMTIGIITFLAKASVCSRLNDQSCTRIFENCAQKSL